MRQLRQKHVTSIDDIIGIATREGELHIAHAMCKCFAEDEIPASSRRCNTVACPEATFQLLVGQHSACRAQDCQVLPASDGTQLVCINALG